MLAHEHINVVLGKCNSVLGLQIDELIVLGPVVMRIRVPVCRNLADLEHLERPLLLDLVVNVEEGPDKPVVGHGVGDGLCYQAKVKGLLTPADESVLKAKVHIAHIDPQVL